MIFFTYMKYTAPAERIAENVDKSSTGPGIFEHMALTVGQYFRLCNHSQRVFLQFFNYRLDVFVLNFIAGPAAVGVYTVSVRLAELVWQMPNAASFVIFPRAAARSSHEMNRFTPRVFRWTLVLTATAALGLAVIARPAIRFIYGSAFDGAFLPMLLLLPGVVLLGGGKVLANDVAGRGFPHYNAIVSGTCLILTVLLDLLLIPDHGAAGAAVASTVAYVAVFGLAAAFWVKVRRRSAQPPTEPSDAGD